MNRYVKPTLWKFGFFCATSKTGRKIHWHLWFMCCKWKLMSETLIALGKKNKCFFTTESFQSRINNLYYHQQGGGGAKGRKEGRQQEKQYKNKTQHTLLKTRVHTQEWLFILIQYSQNEPTKLLNQDFKQDSLVGPIEKLDYKVKQQ